MYTHRSPENALELSNMPGYRSFGVPLHTILFRIEASEKSMTLRWPSCCNMRQGPRRHGQGRTQGPKRSCFFLHGVYQTLNDSLQVVRHDSCYRVVILTITQRVPDIYGLKHHGFRVQDIPGFWVLGIPIRSLGFRLSVFSCTCIGVSFDYLIRDQSPERRQCILTIYSLQFLFELQQIINQTPIIVFQLFRPRYNLIPHRSTYTICLGALGTAEACPTGHASLTQRSCAEAVQTDKLLMSVL